MYVKPCISKRAASELLNVLIFNFEELTLPTQSPDAEYEIIGKRRLSNFYVHVHVHPNSLLRYNVLPAAILITSVL